MTRRITGIRSTAGHSTPGAIEGSWQLSGSCKAVPYYNTNTTKRRLYLTATIRATREGPQHGDPQGGSSERTKRGNGRRPGRRPLQNAGGMLIYYIPLQSVLPACIMYPVLIVAHAHCMYCHCIPHCSYVIARSGPRAAVRAVQVARYL